MRAVVQRVSRAKVTVEDNVVGQIDKGLLVLLAVSHSDTEKEVSKMVSKLINLRIFDDQDQKMNLSVKDIEGDILVVSQFTLYGNCEKGNRPSFINSAKPEQAKKLYTNLVQLLRQEGFDAPTGSFGDLMKVDLVNDGPTTIIIDL